MRISIEQLELTNFKSHWKLNESFGQLVKITGKNGEGKSSIGESITWCLFGTDTLGNTFDPTPLYAYEGDISVSLLLSIEDAQIKLQRTIEDGKNTFYINDVPKKATEFKEYIENLFDKDLFLSIFNPNYFSSQHWKEQRAQLLKYVNEPLDAEVFEKMPEKQAELMDKLLKQYTLAEADSLHKDRFKKRDKEIERAGERVAILREQYERAMGDKSNDLTQVQENLIIAEQKLMELNRINEQIIKIEKDRYALAEKDAYIREQITRKRAIIDQMNEMPIAERCESCKQTLDYNAREEIVQGNLQKVNQLKSEGKELIMQLKQVQHELYEMPEEVERIDTTELEAEIDHYKFILMDSKRIIDLETDIKKAGNEYQMIRRERGESMAVIDSIKEFVDVKATLMVDKVNGLFESLSVKLFETQKNDSIKQTFEIEMDDRPYQKLSTAEKIRAGIELINVLQEQSGLIAPTFVDNAESILDLDVPAGQAIVAAVKRNKLKIDGGLSS